MSLVGKVGKKFAVEDLAILWYNKVAKLERRCVAMAYAKKNERILLPDIPKEQWSDFRIDYENGMTLKEIASKYHCDPRTVRTALPLNRGSTDFGKWVSPKKLEAHIDSISKVLCYTTQIKSLSNLSQHITSEIQKDGYTGGERTVRNYLHTRPDVKALLEKQQRKNEEVSDDQH